MIKIRKKQKGYVMLMMMAFSVLSLSLVSIIFTIENNISSEANRDNLITDAARQTVEFSLAVSKKLGGAGAIPGEKINVLDLKNDKLINKGFPESIAFNQQISSYYVTNPSNNNVIDALTVIEGRPNQKVMKSVGVSNQTIASFYNEILNRGLSIGYSAEDEAEEFYAGIITNNGNTLKTKDRNIDISHVNFPYTQDTFGIYATAPNQVGYWRFRVGPYISTSTPSLRVVSAVNGDGLRSWNMPPGSREIDNEGFTYFCPSNYTKIPLGSNYTYHINNMVTSDNINICIETYKGSVNDRIKSIEKIQIINPINKNTAPPFDSQTSLWGKCLVSHVMYERGQGNTPTSVVTCAESDQRYNVVNPNNVVGLNNNVILNSWKEATTQETKNLYDPAFRNKFDYALHNAVFTSSLNFELDNKNIRMYTYGGRLVTGSDPIFDHGKHNLNYFFGAGVQIQNNTFPATIQRTESYVDNNNVNRNLTLTIPTPKQ